MSNVVHRTTMAKTKLSEVTVYKSTIIVILSISLYPITKT